MNILQTVTLGKQLKGNNLRPKYPRGGRGYLPEKATQVNCSHRRTDR